MKLLTAILFHLVIVCDAFSQNHFKVDSLIQLLKGAPDVETKGLAVSELVGEYMWTKPDSCLFYSKIGLDLLSNPSTREKFESSENPLLADYESMMYARTATALSEQRNDSLAVKVGFKALQLAEKSKDKRIVRRVYLRLAEVYQNIGEPAIAIQYFKKMVTIDTALRVVRMASIGSCYYDLGQYDSALHYLMMVDPYSEIEPGAPWPVPAHFLGKVYTRKGGYENALFYFRIAIQNAELSHLPKDLCDAYIGIAEPFQGLKLTDSSLAYLKKALNMANELSLPTQSTAAVTMLAAIYETKGLIDSAFKYQKISTILKDSLQSRERIKQVQNFTFDEILRQQEISEQQTAYKNKIKTYSLTAGLLVLLLFAAILIRNNKHKQKLNTILHAQKEEIQSALTDLKSTQAQLIHSEKMASLGELTAGIAHEIQNPLNFVNNFSEVNRELIEELRIERSKMQRDEQLENQLMNDIEHNLEKINQHGKRAGTIVKGMLQHSLSGSGAKEPTDINMMVEEYIRLAYHGWKAKDNSFNVTIKTDLDKGIDKISIIPQEFGRVILNLINNAFYAVSEKQNQVKGEYQPTLTISTKKNNNRIEVIVKDNANGIPKKILDKVFQPFFTTKPTGQGTGLGLSLSYDIIKAHNGELTVETREGEGSEFLIRLPTS